MSADFLTVYAYQELLDRGWRRSGTYVYQPQLRGACCPAYTIRLDVTQFQPSAKHRKVQRRVEDFLSGRWAARRAKEARDSAAPAASAKASGADTTKRSEQGPNAHEARLQAIANHCNRVVADALATQSEPWASYASTQAVALHAAGTPKQAKRSGRQGGSAQCAAEAPPQACLKTSLCWQIAGKRAAPAPAQAGQKSSSGGAGLSKKAAKRAAKAQAQARAAGAAAGGVTVSDVAAELSCALLPIVTRALHDDALMGPSSAACSTDRGHVLIKLAASELDRLSPRATPSCAETSEQRAPCAHKEASAEAKRGSEGDAPASPAHHDHPVQQTDRARTRRRSSGDMSLSSAPRAAACTPGQGGSQCNSSDIEGSDISVSWDLDTFEEWLEARRADAGGDTEAAREQWWLQPPPAGGWQLEVALAPSSFIDEEFALWQRYQREVHRDHNNSRGSYLRFLVQSPFQGRVGPEQDPDAPQCGYGAFHMQYRIGPHLVAVGVVDILPRCMSSKYFFWDPDLKFLSLGVYSALREIEWVRNAHAAGARTLKYSYLGFYIHSNQKMRYKAEYSPSELLCRATGGWVPLTPALKAKLDAGDGVEELSAFEAPSSEPLPRILPPDHVQDLQPVSRLESVVVSIQCHVMQLSTAAQRFGERFGGAQAFISMFADTLQQWLDLAGPRAAARIAFQM